MRVGFLINPIAGMGGKVGLKGTDDVLEMAIGRGARPIANERAMRALSSVRSKDLFFMTVSGDMGGDLLTSLGYEFEIVLDTERETTSADTKHAVEIFLQKEVDIIVFCGGDGTARDIHDIVDHRMPVIGIPSGVKMHSAVFANSPEEAGEALDRFRESKAVKIAEVLDTDEALFREGRLNVKAYGHMLIPDMKAVFQPSKGTVFGSSDDEQKLTIAEYVKDEMEVGVLYIIGPGTTTKAIVELVGEKKTILGVDAMIDGKIVGRDMSENEIVHLLEGMNAVLIVTPIGGQGFIFGRGNQQISPKVMEMIGLDNIIIVATPSKLSETDVLRVDTGDPDLDERLRGFRRVIVGYGRYRMMRTV